ncbi:bifunctional adenosylcobinamide kinase/adenosylcobinamide-phosphate guanylyltransferase [Hyphomicrobium sp.]|uniref:bifunctional adenosylcobinamide kinase/adenosylcobinamide-phosphate guanylyltransferase n=1 Tax=Hyphomicrobium sp. TaxID=82 RepID=UPI000F9E88C6|nr:bifunctional adenosylcobinamide kinase/adenosylcobinamide-phosphate guanylyltransferase [Hyphomicrobium sp.]RUO99662.1 MAG: bifunctional adenosylcobinamide kinase/adenosylcobinamide-phosphate guanylyltransferase [Hyphomicrobium sp.]
MSSSHLPQLTLVLGGARSGKSAFAERLLTAVPGPWAYIATAEAFDDEMRHRIAHHKQRRGEGWMDHETPIEVADALANRTAELPTLVDCLTLWVSNLMHVDRSVADATEDMLAALSKRIAPCVVVSNEVGLGIVPENALARAFRDEAGRLNQKIAAAADRVVFVAAGLPLTLKG